MSLTLFCHVLKHQCLLNILLIIQVIFLSSDDQAAVEKGIEELVNNHKIAHSTPFELSPTETVNSNFIPCLHTQTQQIDLIE